MGKLELLAPARDFEAARAAVDYGADALYVGGPAFGARAAAGNNAEAIARIVLYARPFGVRVYAALNTLIYEDELERAAKVARELISAGVDALIIQDTAFLRMGLEGVEFHASTQMCNTSPEHVRFLERSGFSRVILERGLSLKEITAIRRNTGVALECFVHGAICVGFSGRCYLSRSMGPRSGNRGDCMQACRLSYDLVNERGEAILRNKYLLSVPDLDLSDRLGELVDAGVTSFKIEGRLKDTGYVKNVVAHYRRRLDGIAGSGRASSGRTVADFTPDPARSFSRGGSHWMLDGNRPGLASFDTPKATGAYTGKVAMLGSDFFEISVTPKDDSPVSNYPLRQSRNDSLPPAPEKLTAGDGICFLSDGGLVGTNINRVDGRRVYPNKMDGLEVGAAIFRNRDKAFEAILEQSRTRRVIDTKAVLTIGDGRIVLTLDDEDGIRAEAAAPLTCEAANDPAAMERTFRTQIGKSGDTIFNTTDVEIRGGRMPFMPVSAINALRRETTALLLENRMSQPGNPMSAHEDKHFPHPFVSAGGDAVAGGELNVTNSLARQFYADHGVRRFETAPDLRETLDGECVMTSAYCLRSEIGRCLREKPQPKGDLYLRRGALAYRLEFDCARCRMKLIKTVDRL